MTQTGRRRWSLELGGALKKALVLGWALVCLAAGALPARASDSLTVTIGIRDIYPPSTVTDLTAMPGGEGQMLLEWTAPEESGYKFINRNPAAGYLVRIATFSADSVGSTTTWWNTATPASGVPTPGSPGAAESMLFNDLDLGATYYAAIISSDAVGNISAIDVRTATPGQQAKAIILDLPPPAPANFNAVFVATQPAAIQLSWNAVPANDLWYYRVHVDSTPPFDYANQFTIDVASTSTSYLHVPLKRNREYHYYVTAIDRGEPTFIGPALESVASSSVAVITFVPYRHPKQPFGVSIQGSSSTATISWLPVRVYENGDPFIDPMNPLPDELDEYSVYRATAPIKSPWSKLVAVSTWTWSWTDPASGPQWYYHVRASNTEVGLSHISLVRANDGGASIIGYDDKTMFSLSGALIDALQGTGTDPEAAYSIDSSSRPEQLGGRVLKAIDFTAVKGGRYPDPSRHLGGTANLQIGYETAINGLVTTSSFAPDPMTASPENLSVFWYNGSKWVQLYGKLDKLNQAIVLQTKYLGQYQLRAVEKPGAFNFDASGLSNRMITPNGDRKNDNVVFTFANPQVSEVKGRIFDLNGKYVADMAPGSGFSDTLVWDARSGGVIVPGGVYIYEITAEGKTFNGTVVIIK